MGRTVVAAAVAVWLGACGGGTKSVGDGKGEPPVRQTSISARAELVELVFLEAEREFGRERIAALAVMGALEVRHRAIRALGRLGDPRSEEVLAGLLSDDDVTIRISAAQALAIAAAPGVETQLADRYRNATVDDERVACLFALGRVGAAESLPVLAAALEASRDGPAAAAGLALGMFGRRQLPLNDATRAALITAGESASAAVRYGAAYALAREHQPSPDDAAAITALVHLAQDTADPQTRAVAVYGLGRRAAAGVVVSTAIADEDWRVRVEAARALGTDGVDGDLWAAGAVRLAREWAEVTAEGMVTPVIHVVNEGLRALAEPDAAAHPVVQKTAEALYEAAANKLADESHNVALAASTVHCLAAAVRVAGGASAELLTKCGGEQARGMPMFARRALVGEAITNGSIAGAADRQKLHAMLARDADPRVRAAAVDASVALAQDDATRAAALAVIEAGLADPELPVSGSAAMAVAALAAANPDAAQPLHAPLVARASSGSDEMELYSSLLAALAATRAKGGESICDGARYHVNVTIREAARACTEAYTGKDPGYVEAEAAPERIDVSPAGLLGKRVTWVVETTKGTIAIQLDPDTAPWHVAVITSLVDEGAYDGVIFHRVVPDFVVQGGDPTGSGWGGPGFVIPGEPSVAPYTAGAVGIADAGMDTGGSQWFVMHSWAPHLEARYTQIGTITKGRDVADSLLVGDRILDARIDVIDPE